MGMYAKARRQAWERLQELQSKPYLTDTEARELLNMGAILQMRHDG